ncbi:hypothetical protein [Spongiactinospora sp. TRM90649]|uniref:hypothetical protein n=1 Tax=Spongiactinospora sp. TRM90649 TaxID=3031114 RepID=UPI0023F8C32C|nr:hypothetical protein [Spongiactinospora sp. TRM90649]MDF5752084.1 hypothetical protein [Spongiactinospora sp. TRM90649]
MTESSPGGGTDSADSAASAASAADTAGTAGTAGIGRARWARFARHFAETLAAMLVGMLVLGTALRVLLAALGLEYSRAAHPEAAYAEMAGAMAAGMAAWMRLRGHGRTVTLTMTAAMFAPAVVLFPLTWLGVLSGTALATAAHAAMPPVMLLVMLRHRAEFLS